MAMVSESVVAMPVSLTVTEPVASAVVLRLRVLAPASKLIVPVPARAKVTEDKAACTPAVVTVLAKAVEISKVSKFEMLVNAVAVAVVSTDATGATNVSVPSPPLMVSVDSRLVAAVTESLPRPVLTFRVPVTALTTKVSASVLPVTVAAATAPKVALNAAVMALALTTAVAALSVPSAKVCAPLAFRVVAAMPLASMVLALLDETRFTVSTPAIVTVPAVTSASVKVALSARPTTAAEVYANVAPAAPLLYFKAGATLLMLLKVRSAVDPLLSRVV